MASVLVAPTCYLVEVMETAEPAKSQQPFSWVQHPQIREYGMESLLEFQQVYSRTGAHDQERMSQCAPCFVLASLQPVFT